jgi:hypothetical protein
MWACHSKARIDFSRPGKPTDNCYVESFNGSVQNECMNVHWFETIDDARAIIEVWRRDCNESRPHMALNDVAPQAYARTLGTLNAENQRSKWSGKSKRLSSFRGLSGTIGIYRKVDFAR